MFVPRNMPSLTSRALRSLSFSNRRMSGSASPLKSTFMPGFRNAFQYSSVNVVASGGTMVPSSVRTGFSRSCFAIVLPPANWRYSSSRREPKR